MDWVNSPNLFRMFQEGVDPNKINNLSTKAGFAVGTATLIDEVGVDIAMHAATNIGCNPMYGARMNGGDVAFLEKLFDAGFGGKKTGKVLCYLLGINVSLVGSAMVSQTNL